MLLHHFFFHGFEWITNEKIRQNRLTWIYVITFTTKTGNSLHYFWRWNSRIPYPTIWYVKQVDKALLCRLGNLKQYWLSTVTKIEPSLWLWMNGDLARVRVLGADQTKSGLWGWDYQLRYIAICKIKHLLPVTQTLIQSLESSLHESWSFRGVNHPRFPT